MPERTSYAPGTPNWVDIGTDVDAAAAFYSALFGWSLVSAGPDAGGYGFFTNAAGKLIAGIGPQQSPGPPFWSHYVSVVDIDETTARVEAAGGTVVVPPMDVMEAGRMAVFQDAEGAYFSGWQPLGTIGCEVVSEPGAFCWSELDTRDPESAKAFYPAVFGWDFETSEGEDMPYTEWKLDGESIAGMMDMPAEVPAESPAMWLIYFAVDDTEAAVARAVDLGGSVLAQPMDTPFGRFAVLADPQDAFFAVIALAG